jgi:ribosome biogenesis GTPase A
MRISVEVPINFDINESVLDEFHAVLLKVRDASKPDSSFWNQLIEQVEWKLEYIKSRPRLIEENKLIEQERREQIRKEFEELQRQEKLRLEKYEQENKEKVR